MLKRIKPEQVELGMYVDHFEGSWFGHSVWRVQFHIRSPAELARVRAAGVGILIDTQQGQAPRAAAERAFVTTPPKPVGSSKRATSTEPRVILRPRPRSAPIPAFGKADAARAADLARRSTRIIQTLFDECRQTGTFSRPRIEAVVREVGDMIERNTAAIVSVTRLKALDEYTYTHSIAVCALMIGLAGECGEINAAAKNLGMAGILHDIGKLALPSAVLNKIDGLTADEIAQVRRHPEEGQRLLIGQKAIPPVVIDVCAHHHERLDGMGYPYGLKGQDVSRAARMAAICDVYDAMTSHCPYKKAQHPSGVIAEMDRGEGRFDKALLFQFMRCVGVYPTGKLARLRSNRLAVVLAPRRRDSRPSCGHSTRSWEIISCLTRMSSWVRR